MTRKFSLPVRRALPNFINGANYRKRLRVISRKFHHRCLVDRQLSEREFVKVSSVRPAGIVTYDALIGWEA